MKDLTLVIITKDRHPLLQRAINYYHSLEFNIIICDGSSKPFFENSNPMPGLHYLHMPNIRASNRALAALERVKTKFTIFSSDDDFLIPSSVAKGVAFLSENIDYVGVQGQFASFKYERSNALFIDTYPENRNRIIASSDPEVRLKTAFEKLMHQFYAVYKTDALVEAFQVSSMLSSLVHVELCSIIFPLIYGKFLSLPDLWMVRDVERYYDYKNDSNIPENLYIDMRSYVTSSEYSLYRELFSNKLREKHIHIGNDEAIRIFDEIFEIIIKRDEVPRIVRVKDFLIKYMPMSMKRSIKKIFSKNKNFNYFELEDLIESDIKWAIAKSELTKIKYAVIQDPCTHLRVTI